MNKYNNQPLFKLTNFGLTPNIVKGGYQNPVGDGIFQMHATKKGTDNIFVGRDLAVDDKELVRANGDYVEVLSHDLKLPHGKSPVGIYQGLVNGGIRPAIAFNNAFKIQEDYKNNKGINNNKTHAWKGIKQFISNLLGTNNEDNKNEDVVEETNVEQPIDFNELAIRQAYKESTFNPNAVSNANARGLFQIRENALQDYNRYTGEQLTLDDLNDIETNIKVRNALFDNLYNASFIDKPNQSDSIRVAKTLAAYNYGRGNVVNYLNKQKEKGVDIYNGWDWLEELPTETKDYINFILRNQDVNDKQANNKMYQKAKESNKEVVGKIKHKQFGGKTHMNTYKDRINNKDGLLFTINPLSTGSQSIATFRNGGRLKADAGAAAMWTNMGLGLVNTLAQGIAGSYIGRKTREMYEGLKRASTYVPTAREHIVYNDASNAKRDAIRTSAAANERFIDVNTNSSKVAANRRMINNLNKNQGLSEIENYEIDRRDQARNAEAELQTRYNLVDNQHQIEEIREANDFNHQQKIGINNARTTAANTWGQVIASELNTIGGAISDRVNQLYTLAGSKTKEVVQPAIEKLGLDIQGVANNKNSKEYIAQYNKENPNNQISLGTGDRIMTDINGNIYIYNRWTGKRIKLVNNLPGQTLTNDTFTA